MDYLGIQVDISPHIPHNGQRTQSGAYTRKGHTSMTLTEVTQTENWIPANTFAARLTLVRKELGVNGKAFAELCGYDAGTLNNWEHGRVPRDKAEVVAAIAAATGVNRDWLMWGGPISSTNPGLPDDWHARSNPLVDPDTPAPVYAFPNQVDIDLTQPEPLPFADFLDPAA